MPHSGPADEVVECVDGGCHDAAGACVAEQPVDAEVAWRTPAPPRRAGRVSVTASGSLVAPPRSSPARPATVAVVGLSMRRRGRAQERLVGGQVRPTHLGEVRAERRQVASCCSRCSSVAPARRARRSRPTRRAARPTAMAAVPTANHGSATCIMADEPAGASPSRSDSATSAVDVHRARSRCHAGRARRSGRRRRPRVAPSTRYSSQSSGPVASGIRAEITTTSARLADVTQLLSATRRRAPSDATRLDTGAQKCGREPRSLNASVPSLLPAARSPSTSGDRRGCPRRARWRPTGA